MHACLEHVVLTSIAIVQLAIIHVKGKLLSSYSYVTCFLAAYDKILGCMRLPFLRSLYRRAVSIIETALLYKDLRKGPFAGVQKASYTPMYNRGFHYSGCLHCSCFIGCPHYI